MRSPPLAEAWAAEAMRDESALMHDEAAVPQECIMSSITGVIDMASPTPKKTSEATIWPMPRPSRWSSGKGPMSTKPSSCSSRPETMTVRGPKRSRFAITPTPGQVSV